MASSVLEILLRVSGSSQAKAQLQQTQGAVVNLSGAVKTLALGLGAAGLGLAVRSFLIDSVRLASQAKQVKADFIGLSGGLEKAAKNMEAMGRATRGRASELDQMSIANQLLGMGIVKTDAELEKVVATSRRLGAAFRGMGAQQAAEEFALLMANMSIRRLDTFGISSGKVTRRIEELLKATAGMTREEAFFVATMEEAERVMTRLGPEVGTLITGSQELAGAWTDFKTDFGEVLIMMETSGAIDGLIEFVNGLERGAEAWQKILPDLMAVARLGETMREGGMAGRRGLTGGNVQAGMLEAMRPMFAAMPGGGGAFDLFAGIAASMGFLKASERDVESAMQQLATTTTDVGDAASGAVGPLVELKDTISQEVLDAFIRYKEDATAAEQEHESERAQLVKEYGQRRVSIEQQYGSQRTRMVEDFARQQAQAAEDFGRSQVRAMRDFMAQMAQAEAQYNSQRMKLAQSYGSQAERMEEDHQRRMQRMAEAHTMRQEDAIRDRDAITFLRNQREYEVQRRQAEEDNDTQASRRAEDYALQLAELAENYQRQREQRLADFELSRQDAVTDFQLRQERERANHEQRLAQMDVDHAEEMIKFDEEHQIRLSDMDVQFDEERQKREKAWLDQRLDMGIALAEEKATRKRYYDLMKTEYVNWLGDMLRWNELQRQRIAAGGAHGLQAGGYAGGGLYNLGEQGREFVLGNAATRMAEGFLGGPLTQGNILAPLAAMGGAGGNSFANMQNIHISENTTPWQIIVNEIDRRTSQALTQFARGY